MYERLYSGSFSGTFTLGRVLKSRLILGSFVVILALYVFLFAGKAAESMGWVDTA